MLDYDVLFCVLELNLEFLFLILNLSSFKRHATWFHLFNVIFKFTYGNWMTQWRYLNSRTTFLRKGKLVWFILLWGNENIRSNSTSQFLNIIDIISLIHFWTYNDINRTVFNLPCTVDEISDYNLKLISISPYVWSNLFSLTLSDFSLTKSIWCL